MNEHTITDGLRELAELAGPSQVDPHQVGHRIRRRRRTHRAALSAVVALIATSGWLLPGLLANGGGTAVPAAPPGPVASTAPAKLDPEARQVAAVLQQVVAPGRLTVMGGRGLHDKGPVIPVGNGLFEPTAWGVYDDGHGAASVSVDLTRWIRPDTTKAPFTCAFGELEQKPDDCRTVRLPGGGVFNLSKLNPKTGMWNATWTATYAAPDGARVVIQEQNAPGKGVLATRPEPPFDFAQLQRMATSPLWDQQLAAIPSVGVQRTDVNTPFGPDGVGAVFYRLIPAGFTISGAQGADNPRMGNTMVLTDAQGKGSVYGWGTVGGENSAADHVAAFRHDYPNATQLPDGGWLGTEELPGKGGPGTEQYWVAVLHGQSRTVVVALNSVGLTGPRTRPTPVLTIDQLTAIAESPTWSSAK